MTDHSEFLAARQSGIGGSDIAAILGLSRYKSPVDVYLSKTAPEAQQENAEHLYWGHALEAPIIRRFREETGFTVEPQPPIMRHPQHEWALANADALILGADGMPEGILEIKTSSAFKSREWGADDSDEIPIEYIAQVQWYMGIFNVDYGYLAVLIGGNSYKHYRLERDRELFDAMLEKARAFWHRHVLSGIPPEAQNGGDVQQLFPHDDGETAEADTETLAAYNELKALKAQAAELKSEIEAREDLLKTKIGSRAVMQLEGSPLFTWKAQNRQSFDSKAFKSEYPELYARFVRNSETRVLRLR